MILSLKGILYRYTGIFTAEEEELDYLTSDEFWEEFIDIQKEFPKEHPANIQAIVLGGWQLKHGFYRGIWPPAILSSNPLMKIAGWFVVFYATLSWDIQKIKNKLDL